VTLRITYFVHGTTTDNELDLATGWNQGELSELGKKQAVELGILVGRKDFAVVFCSDLKRAVDSAELGFGANYSIVADARLREANYGAFNGKPSALFKAAIEKYIDSPFPGGESYRKVERRIASFLAEMNQRYSGKHIAIVAHQAPQLALEVLVHKKRWEQAFAEDWRRTHAWQPGWEYIALSVE
jgi:broad specificity phosphatase PhoE